MEYLKLLESCKQTIAMRKEERVQRYNRSTRTLKFFIFFECIPIVFLFLSYNFSKEAGVYIKYSNTVWICLSYFLFFLCSFFVESYKGKSTKLIDLQTKIDKDYEIIVKRPKVDCVFMEKYIEAKLFEYDNIEEKIRMAAFSWETKERYIDILIKTALSIDGIKKVLPVRNEPFTNIPEELAKNIDSYCETVFSILETKSTNQKISIILQSIFGFINVASGLVVIVSEFGLVTNYARICEVYNTVISPFIGHFLGQWSKAVVSNTSTLDKANSLIFTALKNLEEKPPGITSSEVYLRNTHETAKTIEEIRKEILKNMNTSSESDELFLLLEKLKI